MPIRPSNNILPVNLLLKKIEHHADLIAGLSAELFRICSYPCFGYDNKGETPV
jgi:hypothetical protein